ncbi:hypothetical protein DIPPA_27592 [Diplonema papillatum]|nr:hypothetical protein DIPPA_27592 [Diplonema papillatum]
MSADPTKTLLINKLRERVSELEHQIENNEEVLAKDAEIEELRNTLKLYVEENKRLHGANSTTPKRHASGTPRSAQRNTGVPHEVVFELRERIEELRANKRELEQHLNQRDKQLSAANVAAMWAHTQLTVVLGEVNSLNGDLEQVQVSTPPRTRHPSQPRSRRSPLQAETNKALADLCSLISASEQGVASLRRRYLALDVDAKIKELQGQVHQWKHSAERQRSEIEQLEAEHRDLRNWLQNGGYPLRDPRDESTRIVSPEVIRMPSHSVHTVNAEHWPIRSVACQTPRGEEQWFSAYGIEKSPRRGTPNRSLVSGSVWDPPVMPGTTPPASPMWTSPSGYDYAAGASRSNSPSRARRSSPGRQSKGLVSSAVLRRHMGARQ